MSRELVVLQTVWNEDVRMICAGIDVRNESHAKPKNCVVEM